MTTTKIPLIPAITIAPVTSGTGSAPRITHRIPVSWELDPRTGYVQANGEQVGRIIESLPGRLYYFQSPEDAAKGSTWGMFPTAHRAAGQGAIRAALSH